MRHNRTKMLTANRDCVDTVTQDTARKIEKTAKACEVLLIIAFSIMAIYSITMMGAAADAVSSKGDYFDISKKVSDAAATAAAAEYAGYLFASVIGIIVSVLLGNFFKGFAYVVDRVGSINKKIIK